MEISWSEVILLIIGAAIGFISSVLMLIVQRHLDNKGKVNIFYRFIPQKIPNGRSWGFDKSMNGGYYFTIPIVYEFQNTSNVTRVIRDVSLLLYKDDYCIGKMLQLDHIHTNTTRGTEIIEEKDHYFGTDKGSYSFVLPPRSIQKQECEYIFKINESQKEDKKFNNIKARYFDEKNKAHYFNIREIEGNWDIKHYDADVEWILLKKQPNRQRIEEK